MTIETFKDLRVWANGHELVLKIYKTTKTFPADERFGLTVQLRRSASSICANTTEGYRKSKKDFIRYLYISQGSLEETKYHLILSKDLGYFNEKQFEELFELANDVGRMLNGLIKSLKY